ncbi:hypothetical protein L3Q82_007418 [Scortum barcoo]|uniref:Uncharacterized protein n=1 Tax=Scortum barcoo TaxID=214431 RepID=A0ACB8WSV9_9TELE|nr:hypothetical protein L3Q82_007418 [Scortum barcoo]
MHMTETMDNAGERDTEKKKKVELRGTAFKGKKLDERTALSADPEDDPHINEQQEKLRSRQKGEQLQGPVTVKNDDDVEKAKQRQSEDNRETEPPACSSSQQMETENHEGYYNILIYSRILAEHCNHVHQVLQRLLKNKLFIKAEKCEFHSPQLSSLGFITQGGQVKADPEKVVAPLTSLTSPSCQFLWNHEANLAFSNLKALFATAPVLTQPDPAQQFMVEVDASDVIVALTWDIKAAVRQTHRQQPDTRDSPPGCLFVPNSACSQVLQWTQASKFSFHPGLNRTLTLLCHHFWWPSMDQDTREFVLAYLR